jgi:hypothetical protein
MGNQFFEEAPAAAPAPTASGAQDKIRKAARQLAYDTRYKVKQSFGKGQKTDPASMQRAYMQQLGKSSAPGPVKALAKKMLVGEDYVGDVKELVNETVVKALLKVFVEGVEEVVEDPEYIKQLFEEEGERKYKIRVSDPKNQTSYVRYATREKISQLRAKGLKVEMTSYGEPYEGEKKRGEKTAAALGGGSAKKDYDGDGKVESGAKEHAGAVHNAIQRKKGGTPDGKDTSSVKEEYVDEAVKGQDVDLRRAASSERQTEKAAHSKWKNSSPGTTKKPRFSSIPHTKTKSSDYANQQSQQISWHDKKSKGKFIHGMTTNEEFIGEEGQGQNTEKLDIRKKLKNKVDIFPDSKVQEAIEVNNTSQPSSLQKFQDQQKPNPATDAKQNQIVQIQKKQQMAKMAQLNKGVPLTQSYQPEGENLDEKITAKTDMGMAIKDFQSSKSSQLAGRSKESRRDAAIAAVLTARRGGKKLGEEASCDMDEKPKLKRSEGGEEDPREIPTKVNLIKTKLGAMGLKMSYEPEGESIDELNRYEKETGKDYKTGKSVSKGGTMGGDDSNSKVMRHMQKVMGAGRMGAGGPIQKRGEKKEPGKKPAKAGEYGSERRSPEQMVKNRRAAKQQGKDNMSSRFD